MTTFDHDQPITSDVDLLRCWEDLMGPLGFGTRRLWVCFITDAGEMIKHITQFDDIPRTVDPEGCRGLLAILAEAMGGVGSVAILFSRPGRHAMDDDDRALARELTASAAELGVPLWPVHFANDVELRVFAPDDLT